MKGRLTCVLLAAVGVLAGTGLAPGPAGASTLPSTLDIVGHGYGHGRGMGQYGALGYASSPYNWSYQQIVGHYYGGTVLAATSVAAISVRLSELDGVTSVAVSVPAGQTLVINGVNTTKTSATITRATTDQKVSASGGADVTVSGSWSTGTTRAFAGTIVVKSSVPQVWNVVGLTQYVEGVVPRESPASWPAAALEAQAVAARSYAVAYTHGGDPADPICDSSYCQNYGGDPAQYPYSYAANSNQAVTATGSTVIECGNDAACGSPSQVAYAEYSSSTGGYSAGGAFPAVVDDGDATSSNPNHDWSVSIPTSQVAAAYPSVGTLQAVTVTGRNGLGSYGGRVTSVVVQGSAGRVTVTGAQFAWAVGLKSDWFAITNTSPPAGSDGGYWVVDSSGVDYPYGDAQDLGSMAGRQLAAPVVGMAVTPDAGGYWMAASDGGIFNFGDAGFHGSAGNVALVRPVVGMAATADGGGYWLVASDGGIFNYGDAGFHGSAGNLPLVRPVVGMAATPDGGGYWLVASDGGIFNYGDAVFHGSAGNLQLDAPIVGMVPTADGGGYWLVASDGGIFNYGDAGFVGSLGGQGIDDVTSVTPTPDGKGYLLVTASGRVYALGDATYMGDPASSVAGWSGHALGISARR